MVVVIVVVVVVVSAVVSFAEVLAVVDVLDTVVVEVSAMLSDVVGTILVGKGCVDASVELSPLELVSPLFSVVSGPLVVKEAEVSAWVLVSKVIVVGRTVDGSTNLVILCVLSENVPKEDVCPSVESIENVEGVAVEENCFVEILRVVSASQAIVGFEHLPSTTTQLKGQRLVVYPLHERSRGRQPVTSATHGKGHVLES